MLELILTRYGEQDLVSPSPGLQFLVLDELHTYRGRQGADVALLMRRAREAFEAPHVQYVGTSATLGGEGTFEQRRQDIAQVASRIFGVTVPPAATSGNMQAMPQPTAGGSSRWLERRRHSPAPRTRSSGR